MAIFKKDNQPKNITSVKKTEKKAKGWSGSGAKAEIKPSILAHRYLLRPRITEKAYALNGANQFVFVVSRNAHKSVIARSVQEAYGVDVIDVRTINLPGKSKAFGSKGIVGSRSATKKAIVTIKSGQSIELFATGI